MSADIPVLELVRPMVGFPDLTRFALARLADDGLVCDLRSLEDPDVSFVVVPPGEFFDDYTPEIDDDTVDVLGVQTADDLLTLVLVTLGDSPEHATVNLRAPLLVKAVGSEGVRTLIDIGGGSGALAIAFAQASPALQAEVLDLATVVPIAARHIAAAGLSDRVRTRVGDLRADAFGSGYDLALLSAICHMLGPDENRDLLRRVFAALSMGGRVVIQDFIMADEKTSPRAGALFAANMLVATPHGGTYSEAEYTGWLREAGFGEVHRIPLSGPNDLVVARRT